MRTIGIIAATDACRFGEIKRQLPGITNTMLTKTLRDLEQIGLISRTQFNEIPPHVEYSLTKAGEDLFPGIYEMTKWSVQYIDQLRALDQGDMTKEAETSEERNERS